MGAAGGYVMVAQAVGKMVAGGFDAVKGGVETAGHVTSDMARNDYMGAFTKSVDAAGDSLKKIPVVGEPAAAALGAVVQPIKSFGEVVDSFVQRGREIGMYNGQLAQANAMADVRSLMGDIREANTVGPEMARLTEAQSKIWDDLRRVLDPIKKVIAEVLANFLEWLEPWVRNELPKIMIQIAESLVGVTAAFNRFTNFQFTKETLKVVEALKAIEDALRKQADPINPLDVFSKMADRVWDVPAEPDPRASATLGRRGKMGVAPSPPFHRPTPRDFPLDLTRRTRWPPPRPAWERLPSNSTCSPIHAATSIGCIRSAASS